ncbi:hypothetical protein DDF62_11300 [Caulobacter radicis]|uniref:hypothetical protein n=1 Tax=Caulobacter radicis TaxID=2172650 RepID=UPI000D5857B7|nr:hypothetical protein [Caulobacter radicis]PVM89687.1 hypothetical protein DDF62_11300 [Caulobacter radicis]
MNHPASDPKIAAGRSAKTSAGKDNDLDAALKAAQSRADRSEAELRRVVVELEAYQQELFESERHGAYLAAERQGLAGQVAYLEALPRLGEPMSDVQSKLAALERTVEMNASYIRSLEAWVNRAEERAAAAEAELVRLRADRA